MLAEPLAETLAGTTAPATEPGRRERNKQDKRQRIRAAASELFARHGYAAATLRDIARLAGVGLGTLFDYADDKRDLVFLIFNDQLDSLADEALAAPRPEQPLVAQLMAIFAPHYRALGATPALSRILLQELTFYSEGKQAGAFLKIRSRLIAGIVRLVRSAQHERRITTPEDAEFVARHLFFVYSAAIRWWIAGPRPNARTGLAELERMLALQLSGLGSGSQPGPKPGSKPGARSVSKPAAGSAARPSRRG
jgi:AcrR family transcriptional regulator